MFHVADAFYLSPYKDNTEIFPDRPKLKRLKSVDDDTDQQIPKSDKFEVEDVLAHQRH